MISFFLLILHIHSFSKLIYLYLSRGFRSTLNHALLLLFGYPRSPQTIDMVHEDYLLLALCNENNGPHYHYIL